MVRSTPLLRFAEAVRRTLTQPIKQSYNNGYSNGYGGSGGGGGWSNHHGSGGGWGGHTGGDRMGSLGGGLKNIDWQSQRLEKFEKNFYNEDKRVTARSDSEIEAFRRAKEMRVSRVPLMFWIVVAG
jgi:ATP-dependent RNA helicase DDX5/DBP2